MNTDTAKVKVENPLYTGVKTVNTTQSKEKQVATARIENVQPGVCPKCRVNMTTANLGQGMGNQTVYFCTTCRVCEPIANNTSF